MNTKRGDMPASPQSIAQSVDGGIHLSSEYGCEGMTIREQFAMAANADTKGLTAGDVKILTGHEYTADSIHNLSVSMALEAKIKVMKADALLAELERTK